MSAAQLLAETQGAPCFKWAKVAMGRPQQQPKVWVVLVGAFFQAPDRCHGEAVFAVANSGEEERVGDHFLALLLMTSVSVSSTETNPLPP
jgi:hypothetical protein